MTNPVNADTNEAWRKNWLKHTLAGLPAGLTLLDAGAGELANKVFCPHLDYVSQDFCQYDGKGNEHALQTDKWDTSRIDIVCDITAIPRPDHAFDVVLCTEVLEHVPDPVAAIKELCRLVKPGGHLIVTAPFCSLTHFSPYHFASGFNRYFHEHHLQQCGFIIEELLPNGNYFSYLAQEMMRLRTVAGKYANTAPGMLERAAIRMLLRFLDRVGARDHGSHEMLCFGYQIKARKRLP